MPAGSRRSPEGRLASCLLRAAARLPRAGSPAPSGALSCSREGTPSVGQTATGIETQEVNGSAAHTTTEGTNASLKEGARLVSWQTEMESTTWHFGLPLELLGGECAHTF